MKIRIGFVSNSSSSSYIVLLSEDVTVSIAAKELFKQLLEQGELWTEQVEDIDKYDRLVQDLYQYVVATIDSGPDAGQITIVNREKVKAILDEN